MRLVGIVGLGVITKYYLKGLQQSPLFDLRAVCDLDPHAASRAVYADYPFYTDYRKMTDEQSLDCLIVSTPPATHFDIASWALSHGVDVIVEKPLVPDMSLYRLLSDRAEQYGRRLELMLHWQHGSEVEAFCQRYLPEHVSEAWITVCDAYSADGRSIDEDRRGLMGAWVDSGINALSLARLWRPFSKVNLIRTQVQRCQSTQLPIYASVDLDVDGMTTHICIDWRQRRNFKGTVVTYEGRRIDIDHSAQCIRDGETLVDCAHTERLEQHYVGCFSSPAGQKDAAYARRIHEILFEVDKAL